MIQCPNCGGALKFDIASQQMKCDSCSSIFDPNAFQSGNGAEESTEYDVTVFRCPQCGGEIASTDETAAAFCSYCGSSNVLEGRLTKGRKPQLIIPFKKTKQECVGAFERFIKKAIFAPKSYRELGRADSFRGIYMPYWLYDMSQGGRLCIPASTSHRSGDYVITDHYNLIGDLNNCYNGVAYDASSSFADDISSDIAPYNVKEITGFNQAYLSGFYADLADVPSEAYEETAKSLAQESTYNYLRKSSPMAGESFEAPKEEVKSAIGTRVDVTRSAMFPVWFMSYRNRNRVAYATVNGQSGKISADIPVSIPKYFLCALAIAAILFVLLMFFPAITPSVMLGIVSIFGLISVIMYKREMGKIVAKENYDEDIGMLSHLEQKKRSRIEAQKGAYFGEQQSAYVVTQNDMKRAKRERIRQKKAKKKSSMNLVTLIVIIIIAISVFPSIGAFLSSSGGGIGASMVVAIMALIVLIVSIILTAKCKEDIDCMLSKKGLPATIWTVISMLIIVIVSFWNPVSDIIYYGAAVAAMIGVIINIVDMIASYNLLAMRPLPQFDMYRGGDDRA